MWRYNRAFASADTVTPSEIYSDEAFGFAIIGGLD